MYKKDWTLVDAQNMFTELNRDKIDNFYLY